MQCPSCAGELLPSHKFCPSCASPVGTPSEMPTAMVAQPQAPIAQAPVIASPIGRLVSSDSIPVGGFTPGMMLADRYRVIGLIGRGGMGEVYRADDLKLGIIDGCPNSGLIEDLYGGMEFESFALFYAMAGSTVVFVVNLPGHLKLWDPLARPPPPRASTTLETDADFLAWEAAGRLFDGID